MRHRGYGTDKQEREVGAMSVIEKPLDVATDAPLERPHDDPILEVNGLAITVPTAAGPVEAVQAASFRVSRGEAVGLVGESGSGKTLTCRAVLGETASSLPGARSREPSCSTVST